MSYTARQKSSLWLAMSVMAAVSGITGQRAFAYTYNWIGPTTGTANWNDAANWSSSDGGSGIPNGVGDTASFASATLTGGLTVNLNQAITIGNLNLIASKNPGVSVTTILDDVYSYTADQFKTTFTPSVLNGTSTAGLARRTADTINAQGWVIATISNWSGQKVDKTTVFYPEGYEEQAALRCGSLRVLRKPA